MRGRVRGRSRRRPAGERAGRQDAWPAAAPPGAEQLVLPLQRSAGNRAVAQILTTGAVLARRPVARAPTRAVEPEARGGGAEPASGKRARVTIAGVGAFDALSVALGPQKKRDDRGAEKQPSIESIDVTKLVDKLTPVLSRLAAEGKPVVVEISVGTLTVRFRDAYISYVQHSGGDPPLETIQFVGTGEIEFPSEVEASAAPS